ncbi:cytochrome C oxidase subunit IV family protein [Portibacter marinus]|uniref:cytochrome C oxidase subunit IV family protein n=1 Tax=Portibacter marinus TaxID=2898660 RepID=UPI001F19833A|nr:cytochrome C oxidase subunit IV family protein [Portibacter marinus]
MSDHRSYEESIKAVYKGLVLLGVVTLVEVAFSLFGKGHIFPSLAENYRWPVIIASLVILILSLYKAYFIIYEFMHMKYEVSGLSKTVLLPCVLLIWAIIAFFWEGNDWNKRRSLIEKKNNETVDEKTEPQMGSDVRILKEEDFQ